MKTIEHDDEYLDCIALKRSIQKQIAVETHGMSLLERLAYYRKLANESPFRSPLRQRDRDRRVRK